MSTIGISCGVASIYGLAGRINDFLDAYERVKFPYPIIVFSDVEGHYGELLFNDLKEMPHLGEVWASPIVRNPNSGNRIRLYNWFPSQEYKNAIDKLRGETLCAFPSQPWPVNPPKLWQKVSKPAIGA